MQHWCERYLGLVRITGVVLLAIVLTGDLARAYQGQTQANGWEYEWIAHAWAAGDGYSLPGKHRWLFDRANPDDRTDPGGHYATAWEEPVPVVLLGTYLWLFGDYGRLAMAVTNALFFAATVVVVYHIGRIILSPWLGLVSAAILVMIPTAHSLIKVYLGSSVPAGLLISICALLLICSMERASILRGLLLGAVVGVSVLTHAPTLVFIPVAALVALLLLGALTWRAWLTAGAIVGAALLVISPWAIRNYIIFDEFVLVKNGAGVMAYLGNRALAEALEPSLVHDDAPFRPPWTANSLMQSVRLLPVTQNLIDMTNYVEDTVRANAPAEYANFNEAQRDKIFMADAIDFILRHPLTTLQLAAAKTVKFLFPNELDWLHLIPVGFVSLLAILGLVSSLKDRRVAALGLMTLAYAFVYVVTFPFSYRYRYPIEPVIAILAGMAVVRLLSGWQRRSAPDDTASRSLDSGSGQ